MILYRAAFGLLLAAAPFCASAQSNGPNDVAPVPLSPLIGGSPNAPLPAAPSVGRNGSTLPAPDLPAPDLPATSMVVPPASGHAEPADPSSETPAAPAQVKPIWNPRGRAVLDVLDKEDGAVHRVEVTSGTSITEGKLAIAVAACLVRPADMTPDAAMFVTVTPTNGTASATNSSPVFRGWLIRSEPGATVIGDAAVTFRLIGCD